MKYVLKTEINANGNKVFSKERRGQQFIYLAKDENGNVGKVDKVWILRNKANIINLAVSGDTLIVSDSMNKKKKNDFDLAKDAASIIKGYYSVVSKYGVVPDFDSDGETQGIYELGMGGTNINHEFDEIIKGFDLDAIDAEYKNLAQNWDADVELVEYMSYFIKNAEQSRLSGEKVIDITEMLYDTVKKIDKHQEKLRNLYDDLRPWYRKWTSLCSECDKEEIIELLENEFSIYELA